MPNLNPPTDDPKLPSFECEEYRKNKPILKRLKHCWYGGFHRLPIAEAELYLPRNFDEDDREYKRRLMRSHYENSFKRTISGFSGAFSKFDLSEIKLPEEFFDNADRAGTSFYGLFDQACQYAMRDRVAFLFPQYFRRVDDPRNRAEELVSGNRPFLSIVQAAQVPNWSIDEQGIRHITLIESHDLTVFDYGSESETLYRTIRRENGSINWKLERIKQSGGADAHWIKELVDQGSLQGSSGRPLSQIPLIPVTVTSLKWWDAENPFPFLDLADLCVHKFQVDSDRREIEYKTVPTWAVAPGPGHKAIDEDGNLLIGSNSYLNVGIGGQAWVVEAQGNGIEGLFRESESIEAKQRKSSLEFAQSAGPERKEIEVKLDLQDVQVNLERMANLLESSLQTCFKLIGELIGVQDPGDTAIAIDMSVFLVAIPDIKAAVDGGFLSKQTAVRRMAQLGYTEDAEEEWERLQAEESQQMQAIAGVMAPASVDEEEIEDT
jgi:hypothetical protein